jgi:hypothetical protein
MALSKAPAQSDSPWSGSIGDGFLKGARSFELKLSRGFGVNGHGPELAHDFWFGHGQMGYVLHDVWAADSWYGGNLEVTGQLFGGWQDHPDNAYFIGLNTGLRYHFATGGRLDPFIAGSIGVSLTDIGLPDLSTKFEFNEQIGAGVRYFLNDRKAVVLEYFAQHISNGSIRRPNNGVNAHFVSLGFSWFY